MSKAMSLGLAHGTMCLPNEGGGVVFSETEAICRVIELADQSGLIEDTLERVSF